MPGPTAPSTGKAFTPGLGPVGLLDFDIRPLAPAPDKTLAGVAKDNAGAVLAGATVKLFRTSDDFLIGGTFSASDGTYIFTNCAPGETYYVVAYKAGAPDVAGTTVNTLAGT